MKSVKCPQCGFVGWSDSECCKKCGAARVENPNNYHQQTPASYQSVPQYYQGFDSGYQKKGMAVTSLVIGLLGFFTFGLVGVGSVVGIVLAVVALRRAKELPSEYGGQGVATAGLVINIIAVVMVVPMGIVAAIAIPNLLAARRAANEGASISVMRRIHEAESTYQATKGNGSYGTLDDLAKQSLIPSEFANGVHFGYKFSVEVRPGEPDLPANFEAVAVPATYGNSGIKSFYVDSSGVIRGSDNRGREATLNDPPLDLRRYSSRSSRGSNFGSPAEDY